MIDKIEKIHCSGCMMCADLCPENAISYEADTKGFWYPIVDQNECTQCGLCVRTCPGMSHFISDKQDPEVYSAWLKNDSVRLKSTSGGIFYGLAQRILSRGGYIAGCRYTEDYKGAYHMITNSCENLEKIIGSKYLQSNTKGMYKEIKSLLNAGYEVLFCGTPCHSAGLQRFLMKSYPGLITVDFICRGINSPKIYRDYLAELEEAYESKVESVHMKNKKAGWESLGLLIKFQNGKEYFRTGEHDWWVQGYLRDQLFTRPSCHYCQFKTLPRVSDITLGDFWGITGVKKADIFKGVSLVMINSEKGKDLFDQIQGEIYMERRTIDEAVSGNSSILYNESSGCNSELFFDQLSEMSVTESIQRCLNRCDEIAEDKKSISLTKGISNFFKKRRL
ncbi:Coenzyme F420 hydrogenase/dehydrogenase, beta subunit C-terminal domain [Acidaminobacter hydrogenoformans]|uniref:Coenzyme F420-reducing hydrogenase, beta subunit n=1 Tax=Acidaminobacter hydrogenoformans DSM 2784 TaxID=1120920 RepID=A0A1G5RS31_9FIRM|nr:Coenzyme F420 hydrogenase/dehydrogenase, beta subunit C-terminal domain [Acidaminobacter hydrogenoformans]SCZ76069.1 Coenzyme F420-reducing hydrogenase, beta subunit [Acidaminobacter hydrogenoformans DSM 2784]